MLAKVSIQHGMKKRKLLALFRRNRLFKEYFFLFLEKIRAVYSYYMKII